jgi:predicted DNA binding CopG/RHH family protein
MKDRFTPKKEVAAKDPADIIAEKQHSKNTVISEEVDDEKHRVSLNLPKDKYDIVKKKSKKMGLTLTAYIITLINSDIEIA